MRNRILMLAGLLLTGCVTQPPAMPTVTNPPDGQGIAAALVFDAPITLDQPAITLSRSTRGPAAFLGYDDNAISYYDIITDNRQSSDFSDQFIRESISERVGSTRR